MIKSGGNIRCPNEKPNIPPAFYQNYVMFRQTMNKKVHIRDSDRTEIQMTTDGLTGVGARDGVTGYILNERGLAAKYVISFY